MVQRAESQQEQAQTDGNDAAFDGTQALHVTMNSTCDEIAQGVCYDEELESW